MLLLLSHRSIPKVRLKLKEQEKVYPYIRPPMYIEAKASFVQESQSVVYSSRLNKFHRMYWRSLIGWTF